MNLVGVGWGVWAVIGGIFLILGILPLLFVHIIVRADEKKKSWIFPLAVVIVLFVFGLMVFTVMRRDVSLEADGLHIRGYSEMRVPYDAIEDVVVYASRAEAPRLRNKTNGMAIPGSIYAGWISCDASVPCYVEAVPSPNRYLRERQCSGTGCTGGCPDPAPGHRSAGHDGRTEGEGPAFR